VFVGIITTVTTALYVKSTIQIKNEIEFNKTCYDIQNKISERLYDHARILLNGKALFSVMDKVTRADWRIYTQKQHLEEQLPGIQGIGFSLSIPHKELKKHIEIIRAEGFADYKIYLGGDRELYTSIIYLEPFSGRNLRAFGYDMFSEPVRRKAMEEARDTNSAILSGKVLLVQETIDEIQAGNLMYVPIYGKGKPIETIEQRRTAILGWVYSPYRMNDLIEGVLGKRDLYHEKNLILKIFDGPEPSSQNLLYASKNDQHINKRLTSQILVDFNGHYWTLVFEQTTSEIYHHEFLAVWLIIAGGFLITLFLFALINILLKARMNALNLVELRTKELRESEKNFKTMVETLPVVIIYSEGIDQQCKYINPEFTKLFGYVIDEVPSVKDWWPLAYPDNHYREQISEEWTEKVKEALKTQLPIKPIETVVHCKDGSKKNIEWGFIIAGEKNYAYGIDITVRMLYEKNMRASIIEKETLLREIHHRVKNNMQIIVRMLRMRARRTETEEVKEILEESQERIQAMALVHEALYKADNLSKIDLAPYIKKLTNNLSRSHNIHKIIDIKLNINKISLGPDQAIAIGIILCELVINSLKYAFPNKRAGEILITVKQNLEKMVELIIQDNGTGIENIPAAISANTLGLTLVNAISTNELNGTMEIINEQGARFVICFKNTDT
jgi:PAS domain S-box-containing protein